MLSDFMLREQHFLFFKFRFLILLKKPNSINLLHALITLTSIECSEVNFHTVDFIARRTGNFLIEENL